MSGLRILVDADACPVKEEIYKVAFRHGVRVAIVSNSHIRTPEHALVSRVAVSGRFDAADDWIAEESAPDAIVVTSDILLAARALKKGATVIAANGRLFTADSIGGQIAARAIKDDLRAGIGHLAGRGPPPYTKADRSRFLSALDEALVRLKRK